MLQHSDSLSATYISDYYIVEEDKEGGYFEPIPAVNVDGVIIEFHSDPIDPVAKNRRKIMNQQLISTNALYKNSMVANLIRKINNLCLAMINQTRVELKRLYVRNQNPKVESRKLS